MIRSISIMSILASFCTFKCMADEGFMGFGLGAFNSAKFGPGEVKMYDLGYRWDTPQNIYWQAKGGFWGQGANSEGMRSSGYASTGPGFRVDLNPVEFHTGAALALITTPDSYLGGVFQFNVDIGVTLRDKMGNGIGFAYSHLSSAGLEFPNQGRDFWVLELSQRF